MTTKSIDELIQLMRTCSLAQVRKQLECIKKPVKTLRKTVYYNEMQWYIAHFYILASKQKP